MESKEQIKKTERNALKRVAAFDVMTVAKTLVEYYEELLGKKKQS